MNPNYILKADVLDIIFDNRNKAYGAYTLRKFYYQRLYKALGITFGFVVMVSALTFLPKGKITAGVPVMDSTQLVTLAKDIPREKPVEPKPVAPAEAAKPDKPKELQPLKTAEWLSKIEITKDELHVDKLPSNLDSAIISNETNKDPNASAKQPVGGNTIPKKDEGGNGKDVVTIDKEKPLLTAEFMPEFPGGIPALRKFLEKNLQNPEDIEAGENISVKVKFIVGYDGKLKGFETIQDGGKAFNNEVIRVLKKMPDWKPGRSNGQNVSVYYVIPVQFRVD